MFMQHIIPYTLTGLLPDVDGWAKFLGTISSPAMTAEDVEILHDTHTSWRVFIDKTTKYSALRLVQHFVFQMELPLSGSKKFALGNHGESSCCW